MMYENVLTRCIKIRKKCNLQSRVDERTRRTFQHNDTRSPPSSSTPPLTIIFAIISSHHHHLRSSLFIAQITTRAVWGQLKTTKN